MNPKLASMEGDANSTQQDSNVGSLGWFPKVGLCVEQVSDQGNSL